MVLNSSQDSSCVITTVADLVADLAAMVVAMSKKANGEGSIYTDARGRLVAVVTVDGRRRTKVAKGATEARKQAHARKLLRDMLTAADRGLPIASGSLTVAELLAQFQTRWVDAQVHAPSTAGRWAWALGVWTDALGRKRVASLTASDVEDALRRLARDGWSAEARPTKGRTGRPTGHPLAESSLVKLRAALRRALSWGEARGMVARNVASLAELPAERRKAVTGKTMTEAEARRFLNACKGYRRGAMFVAALTLGLRPGEVAGLTWEDVDADAELIYVRRSRRRGARGALELAPPKTEASVRTLAAHPLVLAALAERRRIQHAEAEAVGDLWRNEHGLIFTTSTGAPLDTKAVAAEFRAIAKDARLAGRGLTPNDLRHTAASLLADSGMSFARIADQLGHTTTRMLDMHYRHRVQSVQGAGLELAALLTDA
jgi:integrase